MNFIEIANARQSCRSYDETRAVEPEKLEKMLDAARLSPSACNGQPYHFTVCTGSLAKEVAAATRGPAINKFAVQAPVMIVISEEPYTSAAGAGSKLKNNDYRSIDIGITCAYLTAEATAQGLSTCILGWFDDAKLRELCGLQYPARLVITVGYAKAGDPLRNKKRKPMDELVTYLS